MGESSDAFVAELRRLARTVADGTDDKMVDKFVVCQFVDGLPEPTRSQLRALKTDANWTVDAALECAKSMLQQHETAVGSSFIRRVVDTAPVVASVRRSRGERSEGDLGEQRCSGCKRWGHLMSDCKVRCFGCHQVGHLKRDCPATARAQGNDHWGAV